MAADWGLRRVVRVISAAMLITGLAGFIGQGLTSGGAFGQMRGVEWPVGRTSDAVALPDGRYAVPLEHVGRVQVYSQDLEFQHGWQLDASGGIFRLLPAEGGNLEAFTARGNRQYLFSPDGQLLAGRTYDASMPYPPRSGSAMELTFPTVWWKFPLRGPFHSWAFGMVGMLLYAATRTRAERVAERRRARQYASRPSGPIGRAVKTAGSWFAAAIWAGVGFVWFFSTLAWLIRSIADGNVVGTLIAVPFMLIGCVLLFISLTIIQVAVSEAMGWFRKKEPRSDGPDE